MEFDFRAFKVIMTIIKQSRKGAALTIFLICICCGIIDYFLRKHGIAYIWFGNIYLTVGFISFTCWAVKVFNKVADIVDGKERESKWALRRKYFDFFDLCDKEERELIFRFYKELATSIKADSKECQIANSLELKGTKILTVDSGLNKIFISDEGFDKILDYFDKKQTDFNEYINLLESEEYKLLQNFYTENTSIVRMEPEKLNLSNMQLKELKLHFLNDLWVGDKEIEITQILFYFINEYFEREKD